MLVVLILRAVHVARGRGASARLLPIPPRASCGPETTSVSIEQRQCHQAKYRSAKCALFLMLVALNNYGTARTN